MANGMTGLRVTDFDSDFDKMLRGVLCQNTYNKAVQQEIVARHIILKRKNIQHYQMELVELILLWLGNHNPVFHPLLKLFPNREFTSSDQKFLERATTVINQYLSHPDFEIETFAMEMAVSRSQLYRRFNAITGKGPSDFVRRIRMVRAARLIEQKFGNITEVALEVGYNNVAHFSKCFKSHFGMSPSRFAKNSGRN